MKENKLVNASIIFIAAVFFVLMLREFQSFLRPFAIALILMFLLMPLLRWGKKHHVPTWANLSTVLVGVLVLLILIGIVVAGEGTSFATSISEEAVAAGISPLDSILGNFGFANKNIQDFIDREQVANTISGIVGAVAQGGTQLFSELFLVFLFLIFILPSHDVFIRGVTKDMEESKAKHFKNAILEIENSIKKYLLTKSLVSFLTALATGIVLLIFRADLIIVLMLLTFFLNFIPNIGSIIAVFVALFIFTLTGGLGWSLLWLGIILIIVQQFFGSYLEPKIAGKKLNMSPLIILLSLFFWGWVWGLPGMLISVPLTAIIKIAMEHIKGMKKVARFMS